MSFRLGAVAATPNVPALVGIPPGMPILPVERSSYREGHRSFDYEHPPRQGDLIPFFTARTRQPVAGP